MIEKSINNDIYYTLAKPHRAEIKIKGSSFIASVCSVNTKTDAMLFLDTIRSEFFDATHNCFAYQIGHNGLEYRFSDDGEPNGTAGKPILFTLKKYDVSDVICVVTRYFGGTKLGVGGLSKAYQESAAAALAECERKPIHITQKINIYCTYEIINVIKRLISQYAVSYTETYQDTIDISAEVHKSKADEFIQQIITLTNGKATGIKVKD